MTPGTPITLMILEQTLQGLLIALAIASTVGIVVFSIVVMLVRAELMRKDETLWRIIDGQARRISVLEARVTHLFSGEEDKTLEYRGIKFTKERQDTDGP